MNKIITGVVCIIVLIALLLYGYNNSSNEEYAPQNKDDSAVQEYKGKVYRIGTVGEDVLLQMGRFEPLAKYLTKKINISEVKFSSTAFTHIKKVASAFKENDIDIYIDSPMPIYRVKQSVPIDVVLRRWKKGVGKYRSVLFCTRDSLVNKIDDITT